MDAADALIATAHALAAAGHLPATSGNLSARASDTDIWLTASGRHKGRLTHGDLLRVAIDGGTVVEGLGRPSAETALHLQRYRAVPATGAVLHVHDRFGTALTMADGAGEIVLEGYELLKAIEGVRTHDARVVLPVFDNTQDIDALAAEVDVALDHGRGLHGYLIRGHGLYTWGPTVEVAGRHVEALLFLLEVEWMRRSQR